MMYGKIVGVLCSVVMLANPMVAQKMGSSASPIAPSSPLSLSAPGSKIDYYSDNRDAFTQVSPPTVFLQRKTASGRPAAPKSQFIVTYTNFTPEAKRAFQYAVDIWSTLITSSVPIRIQANWISDTPGLLGSAGPTSYRYRVDGAQKATAFYPIALAEKIAHRELNTPGEADIIADFNRNNEWYFGTDGLTPRGQTDMVTAVLHELTHGLGFIGFFNTTTIPSGQNVGQYLATLPSVYDCFIETGGAGGPVRRLVTSQKEFPNNSPELNQQLTGNDLFLNGAILRQTTVQKLRLHAKSNFFRSTSIYHLDEDTYPTGDANSLMTPTLKQAESIHSPGPLVTTFFSDMEWKTTSVLHTPLTNSEEAKDLLFSARIVSDTTIIPASGQLFYRKSAPTAGDTAFTAIPLVRIDTTNEYRYTLPAAQAKGDIWYYFQAQDVTGKSFVNPGRQLSGAKTWHHIQVGPDTTPPTIQFSPAKHALFSTTTIDSLPIYARISDDRSGVASAYVDYQINGVTQPNLPLTYNRLTIGNFSYDSIYANRVIFPANSLKVGDKVTYRIVAQDNARTKNQRTNPANGFYQLTVVGLRAVRDEYTTTFNEVGVSSDFAGNGFSITTPVSFGNPAIHSEHPYRNGDDFKSQATTDMVLLTPIRIKANPDSAYIRFDEIVLVESGDASSRLGDATFYDYVIVEGSGDGGRTWKPLTDAYTSSDRGEWLTAYNSDLIPGLYGERNSKAGGFPAMYRKREMPLLKPGGAFKAGDQVLIRFRLFADQLSYGWGWSIDNLRIQAGPPPPVLAVDPVPAGTFRVYPNPVSIGLVKLEADLPKILTEVMVTIIQPTGQLMRQYILKASGTKINEQLDLSQLPEGVYFVQLKADDLLLTQKVIIVK
jgi:hypothetical protein